jgi:hypothetical protein
MNPKCQLSQNPPTHVVDLVGDASQAGVALHVDDQLAVALGHVLEGGHVDDGVVLVTVARDGDGCGSKAAAAAAAVSEGLTQTVLCLSPLPVMMMAAVEYSS